MKKILLQILVGCLFIFILSVQAFAHCEIPCGIYDDEMRIRIIYEHIVTVEKSMKQIIELEKGKHHESGGRFYLLFFNERKDICKTQNVCY
jgi:nickel superoxide dismutase